MSGGLLFGIIAIGAMVIILVIVVIADKFDGSGKREELNKVKEQRNLAYEAIEKIAEALEEYKEIDYPLASKLAPLISEFKKKEWELRK